MAHTRVEYIYNDNANSQNRVMKESEYRLGYSPVTKIGCDQNIRLTRNTANKLKTRKFDCAINEMIL